MRVRPLRSDEAALFKQLRLRALADSPDAFAQTLAAAEAEPEAYWAALTRSVTEPGRQVMFVVEDGALALGLAFGLLDARNPDTGRVGGMWVDPPCRGRGAGQALLDALLAWARGLGLSHLELWVTEGNASALALYRKAGFVETGAVDRLPSNPRLQTIQMARCIG